MAHTRIVHPWRCWNLWKSFSFTEMYTSCLTHWPVYSVMNSLTRALPLHDRTLAVARNRVRIYIFHRWHNSSTDGNWVHVYYLSAGLRGDNLCAVKEKSDGCNILVMIIGWVFIWLVIKGSVSHLILSLRRIRLNMGHFLRCGGHIKLFCDNLDTERNYFINGIKDWIVKILFCWPYRTL